MTISPDFFALFQASPYPYLLIDTGFMLIGANPAYLRATGRSAEELVGKHIFDAFPPNPADPDSTNLEEVRASIELAIATRKPHTSALVRYAVPRQTAEGPAFDERYWSAVHSPVFDAAGNVAFVAQNVIDVTALYQPDSSGKRYHLKQDAQSVRDAPRMSRPQLHEAMTRILSAERSQLQMLFDQAPGFMAVMSGRENVFEMVNNAFYELVGRRALVGRPAREALPELVGQGFKELLEGAFRSGQRVVLRGQKMALRRRDGAELEDRYVDMLFQPILGQDLRVTGIFVQGSDVTAAHRVGQQLSQKLAQLEAIRSSQAFQLELADRIRQLGSSDDVTDAACALLGRRLDVSRVLYAEVDDARGTIFIRRDWTAPDFASLAGQTKTMDDFGPDMIADLRAGRTVVNSDVALDPRTARHTAAYERIGIRSDLLLPVLKAGRLHVVLTIQDGAPRHWLAQELELARDVAERTWAAIDATQAQAALRAERDQSQYIFDSMAEGFAEVSRDWTILRMNAEGLRLNGRGAAEIVGRNHWDVFPELKGSETEAVYRRVMETGRSEIVELSRTLPDDSRVWSEIRVHRSLDGGIAFFFRDITERHAAQEQLRLADQRKDEFLAMLAHELRNPLAPIGAAAQLLQIARLDPARVRQTSQVIGRQVAHMTHLIDDLLDVSRVTRGLVKLDNAPQDIRDIVAEAVEQVAPLMQARRHQLVLQLAPETSRVLGDRKRLVQVFTNILNNAAKYTGEGGRIVLRSEVQAGKVLVETSDNGIGMDADLAAHVFDLFAQAERTSDRSAGGLGLGLALVKSLVGLHGGSVSCHSPGPGQGSTFTVCLPRLAAGEGTGMPAAGAAGLQDDARSLRILVVDDNVDAAAMLGMLLEASGHRVAVEYGAREALARAQADSFDACLLDIGLPEMDGNELAGRLRALPGTSRALLVAVTGYGQESDRQRTREAGFDHHLVKPLDPKTLSDLLAQA